MIRSLPDKKGARHRQTRSHHGRRHRLPHQEGPEKVLEGEGPPAHERGTQEGKEGIRRGKIRQQIAATCKYKNSG